MADTLHDDRLEEIGRKFGALIDPGKEYVRERGLGWTEQTPVRCFSGSLAFLQEATHANLRNPDYRAAVMAALAWLDPHSAYARHVDTNQRDGSIIGEWMRSAIPDAGITREDFNYISGLVADTESRTLSGEGTQGKTLEKRTQSALDILKHRAGLKISMPEKPQDAGPTMPAKRFMGMKRRTAIASALGLAAIGTAAVKGAEWEWGSPPPFNLLEEAEARKQKKSTLTNSQVGIFKGLQADLPNMNQASYEAKMKARNHYFATLDEINEWRPNEQGPLLGRLLYHAAREKQYEMIANLFVHCPVANSITFIRNKSHSPAPVGFKGLIGTSTDLGDKKDLDIKQWSSDEITTLNQAISRARQQVNAPSR